MLTKKKSQENTASSLDELVIHNLFLTFRRIKGKWKNAGWLKNIWISYDKSKQSEQLISHRYTGNSGTGTPGINKFNDLLQQRNLVFLCCELCRLKIHIDKIIIIKTHSAKCSSLFFQDLPNPGIKSRYPTLQADSLPAEPQGKPKNTGVGSLSLLQAIFPTQESNQGLLHCRQILYQLSYQGPFLFPFKYYI